MVVASGGWVQNASIPANQNNSNLNVNTVQNNKMTAKGILICRDNSHPFQDRMLSLQQAVKIGRSVARARATPNNAIFDCKVLSRNHALLWYSGGKFFLQDTRSSNGTFVNNHRLSPAGLESAPKEVCSGDIVQFGVDVVENTKKVTHGCIIATLKLYLPNGIEAKASLSTSVTSPVNNVSLEDLYKLNQVMQEASRREKALHYKLEYLQQLVEKTRKAADQSWKALITEDRLLSWVETIESQLAVYSENYKEDAIRSELVKLQEEKAQYQNAAKEALHKVFLEKLEVAVTLYQTQACLSKTEGECQSLHNVAKFAQNELQEVCTKYTEAQKKLQETTNKLEECENKMKDTVQNMEQEKRELVKKLEHQAQIEKNLQTRLRDSRSDSFNLYNQILALKNYTQVLLDMNSELLFTRHEFRTLDMIPSSTVDSEEKVNPINIILDELIRIVIDYAKVGVDTNHYPSKDEQDNQINSQDADLFFSKEQMDNSLSDDDNLPEYILPEYILPRTTLVNGNGNENGNVNVIINLDNSDSNLESDTNSDATDDTCSITSDDTSEKSVIEVKKEEEKEEKEGEAVEAREEICLSYKQEVKFIYEESDKQAETFRYSEVVGKLNECEGTVEKSVESMNNVKILSEPVPKTKELLAEAEKKDETDKDDKDKDELDEELSCEGEHLEGEYVKTLKPLSKNDSSQSIHTREYVLQTLIGSLDSLKAEDDFESQQVIKKELECLKDWLVCEPHEDVIGKLKELYYRAKNEAQRIQELHEELVILKEKYNILIEEKTDLSKKYTTLKAQCGDLLNTTYTVPIHYVAPIAIMLIWMLLEKFF